VSTSDGWLKIADQWPAGWDSTISMNLPASDEFDGTTLGMQWRFFQTNPTNKTQLSGGALTVNSTSSNVFPIGVTATHTSYKIETNVTIASGTSGGLMLYYSQDAYMGIGLGSDGKIKLFNNAKTTTSGTADWNQTSARLCITNDSNMIRCYYLNASGQWKMVGAQAYNTTSFNTTVYGGYGVMRPGIFAAGTGKVTFDYFRYTGGPTQLPTSLKFFGNGSVTAVNIPDIKLINGNLTLRNTTGSTAEIVLMSSQGRIVCRRTSVGTECSVRVSDVPNGIYLARITVDGVSASKKVAIVHK